MLLDERDRHREDTCRETETLKERRELQKRWSAGVETAGVGAPGAGSGVRVSSSHGPPGPWPGLRIQALLLRALAASEGHHVAEGRHLICISGR